MPFYNAKNYSLDRSIGFLLNTLSLHLNERLEPLLKSAVGITMSQWQVLASLQFHHVDTAAMLSAALSHDSGAMTRMIDKLASFGFVKRRDDVVDRRAYKLKITKKGTAACAKGFELARSDLNEFLVDFSSDEAETLIGLLQKMKRTSETLKTAD